MMTTATMMMMTKTKTTPQSSSSLSLVLIFLVGLMLFSTGASGQESKSRLLEAEIKQRHQFVTVPGHTPADWFRHSWNTIAVSGGTGGGSRNSNVKSSSSSSPNMCFQLQRIRHFCPPFPAAVAPPTPLSPSDYEIDPRYGVEKRLVPSGPNPLHN